MQMQNIQSNNSRSPNAEARATATMNHVSARSKQKRGKKINSQVRLTQHIGLLIAMFWIQFWIRSIDIAKETY